MQRLLETEIEVNFTEAPLTDVTKWMSDKLDEEVAIDIEALTEEGIRTDSPVTFQGRFAAGIALSQILEPLQLAHQFRHGTVYVSTIHRSKERLQTVVYDVADFLQVGHSMQGLMHFIEDSTAGPWLNSDGEGGTQTEFSGGLLVIRQIASVHDEIVVTARRPAKDAPGNGSIAANEGIRVPDTIPPSQVQGRSRRDRTLAADLCGSRDLELQWRKWSHRHRR